MHLVLHHFRYAFLFSATELGILFNFLFTMQLTSIDTAVVCRSWLRFDLCSKLSSVKPVTELLTKIQFISYSSEFYKYWKCRSCKLYSSFMQWLIQDLVWRTAHMPESSKVGSNERQLWLSEVMACSWAVLLSQPDWFLLLILNKICWFFLFLLHVILFSFVTASASHGDGGNITLDVEASKFYICKWIHVLFNMTSKKK